ncbi:MAG: alanine--tRNA ligase [Candidatus Microgenomates bacterium]|jgi:alanyl-tRNA synthetase
MKTSEVREKYLKFFEKRGHKIIPAAPLVLENDPTTLFTSAGMQPLIPYLKGEPHPKGKRLVDSQPSLRLEDIEEVGDNRHTTFFEMLGNWSLGDYFKKEQLSWIWEFFTKELGLPKEKLYVSVFEGGKAIPKDTESEAIWKSLGVPPDHIVFYDVEKNWWSRSGQPDRMPAGEIGGPDSEIFFDFGSRHDPRFGKKCHPNCNCGRFLEIGNSVFIQYEKQANGSLKELPRKNVDFGGGLERITAAINDNPDIFKIDVFVPTIRKLENLTNKTYRGNEKAMRIIADHLRASTALVDSGVIPANKIHGYVLRRLIRKMAVKLLDLGVRITPDNIKAVTADEVILEELLKFNNTLERGLKEIGKIDKIDGKIAFDLYQSFGFPLELTADIFEEKGQKINREEFEQEFTKHKELSRTASSGMFKGGLADAGEQVTKYHTATHLLHAALRQILGDRVTQKGSNITTERLRFDFSYPQKLTDYELQKVEDLINVQIEKKLPVTFTTESLDDAIAEGALHFFAEKYGDQVKVYSIGNFSKEVCGGPHVSNTEEIGRVRIIKQEKVGSAILRIYMSKWI